jgi:hypothetical protein
LGIAAVAGVVVGVGGAGVEDDDSGVALNLEREKGLSLKFAKKRTSK